MCRIEGMNSKTGDKVLSSGLVAADEDRDSALRFVPGSRKSIQKKHDDCIELAEELPVTVVVCEASDSRRGKRDKGCLVSG